MDLRPFTRDDYPLMARWLAEPVVARWWAQPFTDEAIEKEYGAAIDGNEPTDLFVACDPEPVGFIQRFVIHDYPEYVEELTPLLEIPKDAYSVDYLVGEPDARGRGLCARMIAAAVAGLADVIVPVHAENRASWRSLEKAGFVHVVSGPLEPDNPADSTDHVIYRKRG